MKKKGRHGNTSKTVREGTHFTSLENVREGSLNDERDSFDMLNFSNDINLAGMNMMASKDLENRLTNTLHGISSTYNLLSSGSTQKHFDYNVSDRMAKPDLHKLRNINARNEIYDSEQLRKDKQIKYSL